MMRPVDLKPLWDINCFHKEIVLTSSFEKEELERLVKRHCVWDEEFCPGFAEQGIFQIAHHLCHEGTPVAIEIQERLDGQHRKAMETYYGAGAEGLRLMLFSTPLSELDGLPGLIWAAARDGRSEFQKTAADFMHHVLGEAVRTVVFGSRDLFIEKHRNMELRRKVEELKQGRGPSLPSE